MITYQFPLVEFPFLVYVKDKSRNSGLTACKFYKDNLIVATDWGQKKCHLIRLDKDGYEFLYTGPTVDCNGDPVETDLIDLKGDRLIMSNFFRGTLAVYEIRDNRINFIRELNLSPDKFNMHGLRFIPGHENLVWLTYCGNTNKSHEIWDIEKSKIVHSFDESEQCQDVAFLDGFAVIFGRTDHMWIDRKPKWWSKKSRMYASAFVYDMKGFPDEAPRKVSSWKGKGHLDAALAYKGHIFATNQYLSRVDVFSLNKRGRLSFVRSVDGFNMPHGLDIENDQLLVTNYGDQTLRLMDISELEIPPAPARWGLSLNAIRRAATQ